MNETETIEFKEKLNEKFEKEIVGFLNTARGGVLYLGVDDDGIPVGIEDIDGAELQIKDKITNNISPSALGLFEIVTPPPDDHIQIVVSGGNQSRPAFLLNAISFADRRSLIVAAFMDEPRLVWTWANPY